MKYSELSHARLVDAAEDEAAMFMLPPDWREGREHVEGYAIDEAYVRDVDDAVLATPGVEGNAMLTVSIADTASFLSEPSAIRTIARRKGWTKYSGDPARGNQALNPMIPKEISEGALSLQDSVERPVFAVRIPVDKYGALEPPTIAKGIIHAQRFTPNQVDTALGLPETSADADSMAIASLRRLAQRLHHDRVQHGLRLELDMRSGRRASLASFIVEETMVAANRAIAGYMHTHQIPGLYRVFDGTGLAYYNPHPNPHNALNVPLYLHGTSPLRRFPDFVNQANIVASIDGRDYPYPEEKLERVATRLNEMQEQEAQRRPQGRRRANTQRGKRLPLQQKLQAEAVSSADVTAGLFYDGPNPDLVNEVRVQAMQRLAEDPNRVRQVLNIAADRRLITIRRRTPEDPAAIRTRNVVEDAAGNVYSFFPRLVKSRAIENDCFVKAPNLLVERSRQIVQDLQLLSDITGLEVEHVLPLELQPEHVEHIQEARKLLDGIDSKQPCSLQYNYEPTEDGGCTATVFMAINGEVQSAAATRQSRNTASAIAAYQLASRFNLFDQDSRIQLGLQKAETPKKKPTGIKGIEGHSPQHYLQQHLMKTVQVAPRYSVTRHESDDDAEAVDCTVMYQDESGRSHIVCVTATGRKKAKSLVAEHALRILGMPILNKLDEQPPL